MITQSLARHLSRVVKRGQEVSAWTVLAYAMIGLYAVYFAARTVEIHQGFGTSAFDFGLYDQGMWLLSRGKTPFVTLMGRNLFGDHSSFILIALVPLYWVFSSTATLFVVQAIVIAAGAIPVFLYSRRRLESLPMGAAMVAVYLLHPAVNWTMLENYHPDSFLALFVGFALYGALEKNWRMYWVATVLALLVKEDVALVLGPIGLWVALRHDVKRGLATTLGSGLAMLFTITVVMKHFTGIAFRNGWRIPFGGFGGLTRTAITRPWLLVAHLASGDRPMYLWQMFAPVGFIFVIAPEVALTGALVLFTNILSTFWYQFHIEYHYSLVVVPAIVMGSAFALGKIAHRYRAWLMGGVLICSLLTAYIWSPLPGGRTRVVEWHDDHPAVGAADELFALIDDAAVISVYHQLAAQLARRTKIYAFPNPFVRSLYGPDTFAKGDRLAEADSVQFVMLPETLLGEAATVWQAEAPDFVIVAKNEWWILYQRAPHGATVSDG